MNACTYKNIFLCGLYKYILYFYVTNYVINNKWNFSIK